MDKRTRACETRITQDRNMFQIKAEFETQNTAKERANIHEVVASALLNSDDRDVGSYFCV